MELHFVTAPILAIGIGLSLAANSFAGWLGHLGREPFAWGLTGAFLLAALAGTAAGAGLGGRMRPATLRLAFGWFVLAVAGFVAAKNWPALIPHSPPTQPSILK